MSRVSGVLWLLVLCASPVGAGAATSIATQIASFKNGQEVALLQFSPDGRYLAVAPTQELQLHIWAWQREPHIVRTLTYPPPSQLLFSRNGLQFSPDGNLLAYGDPMGDVVVTVYDVVTGSMVHQITEPARGGGNSNVAFTPDGKYLLRTFDSANAGVMGQIEMYRADTWQGLWHLDVLPLFPYTMSISRDGKYAAVGGETLGRGVKRTGRILIIDLATHAIIRTIDDAFPPKAPVRMVAWAPDGTRLAAGTTGSGIDGLPPPPEPVKIIDTKTGRVIVSEPAPRTTIVGLEYSPDGRYLVESGDDWPSVRIWDGEHRSLLQEIPVHTHESFAIAVSSDSRYLAISDRERVTVWKLQ